MAKPESLAQRIQSRANPFAWAYSYLKNWRETRKLKRRINSLPEAYRPFDPDFYLASYPDLVEAKVDPLEHWINYGQSEGRNGGRHLGPHLNLPSELKAITKAIEREFDAGFYLKTYPDVLAAGVDPLLHYVNFGAKEGRNPSPLFSTAYYLENNPDVRDAGINPFWHYTVAGKNEGRMPKGSVKPYARILNSLRSIEDSARSFENCKDLPTTLDHYHLTALLQTTDIAKNLVLAFCHDNYTTQVGGVQICMQIEQIEFQKGSYNYLAVYPWQPLPTLVQFGKQETYLLNLVFNGENIGTVSIDTLIESLACYPANIWLILHQMLGHAPEAIVRLARSIALKGAYFWIHDYFAVCPGTNLLRNKLKYCGAPPITSMACQICVFGEERKSHYARMKSMFDAIEFAIVSPSDVALSIWESTFDAVGKATIVLPHCEVQTESHPSSSVPLSGNDGPIRVGFTGHPADHKGWNTFSNLIQEFGHSAQFEFHHFGTTPVITENLITHEVSISTADLAAMSRAVFEANIDIIVIWSIWPETFSFATYEAIAAGSFVLVHRDSGNVAVTVNRLGAGIVLDDDESFFQLFASGKAVEYAKEFRLHHQKLRQLTYSRMTAEFVLYGHE